MAVVLRFLSGSLAVEPDSRLRETDRIAPAPPLRTSPAGDCRGLASFSSLQSVVAVFNRYVVAFKFDPTRLGFDNRRGRQEFRWLWALSSDLQQVPNYAILPPGSKATTVR